MKNLFLLLPVVVVAFAFGGCSKKNNGPSNTASVMFVNGCVLATNIEVKSNNAVVTGAGNVPFTGTSGYQNVTGGSTQIEYYVTSPLTLIDTQSISLTIGKHYSVFFANSLVTSPSLKLYEDDLTAPPSGYAKIRFANLSSDALNETASVGDSTFASNITSGGCSGFYQVLAGTYVIKAGDPSNISTVINFTQLLEAGRIYTIILTGNQSGSGTSGLQMKPVTNS